jgi:hypothetical protein
VIEFDAQGMLIPNRNIEIALSDFKFHFVDSIPSDTRNLNFEKYIRYSNELKDLLQVQALKQWINGSFVTSVKNPRDIDLVTFIDYELRLKYKHELEKFEAPSANNIYDVDAYIVTVFPENHSKAFLFESDQAYWMARFTMTRRNLRTGKKYPKGFLEISY